MLSPVELLGDRVEAAAAAYLGLSALEGVVEPEMLSMLVAVACSQEVWVAQIYYYLASLRHPCGVASEVAGPLNHQEVPLVWEKFVTVTHEQTQPRLLLQSRKTHEGATLGVFSGYPVRIPSLFAATEELAKGTFQGLTSWPSFLCTGSRNLPSVAT